MLVYFSTWHLNKRTVRVKWLTRCGSNVAWLGQIKVVKIEAEKRRNVEIDNRFGIMNIQESAKHTEFDRGLEKMKFMSITLSEIYLMHKRIFTHFLLSSRKSTGILDSLPEWPGSQSSEIESNSLLDIFFYKNLEWHFPTWM